MPESWNFCDLPTLNDHYPILQLSKLLLNYSEVVAVADSKVAWWPCSSMHLVHGRHGIVDLGKDYTRH